MEYSTGYSFKPDAFDINGSLIAAARILETATKNKNQYARSVLSKTFNKVSGSMTVGAMMMATMILGFDDHHLSHPTAIHDLRLFTASMLAPGVQDTDLMVQHEIVASQNGKLHLTTALDAYKCRNNALDTLSPVEVSMMFNFTSGTTKAGRTLPVQDNHPQHGTHVHEPRARVHMPQFISNPPVRPLTANDDDTCEKYAAFALGNFFPDRCLHQLQGDNLWQKFIFWETHKPRGELDLKAWQMLHNLDHDTTTRALALEQAREVKSQHKLLRKAFPSFQTDFDDPYSSDDDSDDVDAYDDALDGADDYDDEQAMDTSDDDSDR